MDIIKEIALEYLAGTPVGQGFQKTVRVLQKIQENAVALAESDEDKKLTAIKAGTVLMLCVLKKVSEGRLPKDFTTADFRDIAGAVSEYAVLMDGQDYSVFVFSLYERYIEYSATELMERVPAEKCNAIKALAEELRIKAERLKDGSLSEPEYTEDCLWICLDAMVKMLSAYVGSYTGPEVAELIEGASSFAFEYGRLALYNYELALVTEYLEKQKVLDEELQEKYARYLALLENSTKQYSLLIQNAFDSDFRTAFTASVQLAEASGVKREEILDTQEKIDEFFLS